MDYDSITGRLALFAAGMVAAAGPRRAEGQIEGSGTRFDGSRQAPRQPRDGARLAQSGFGLVGMGDLQQQVGRLDAGTRGRSRGGVERLGQVKPQDFRVLFWLTVLFWCAVLGGQIVLLLMAGD